MIYGVTDVYLANHTYVFIYSLSNRFRATPGRYRQTDRQTDR